MGVIKAVVLCIGCLGLFGCGSAALPEPQNPAESAPVEEPSENPCDAESDGSDGNPVPPPPSGDSDEIDH